MHRYAWFHRYLAACRAVLLITVLTGIAYPVLVWALAALPGLHPRAEGSLLRLDDRTVGSALIGQSFTDAEGTPLPWYFQPRPSDAGAGYDATASGASNLGPESIEDTPADPALLTRGFSASEAGFSPSLLTRVCTASSEIGHREGVDGSRPYCTTDGVAAVLAVFGARDSRGEVSHPTRVVSINEPCGPDSSRPAAVFVATYENVPVECARYGADYSAGLLVPIRGDAPDSPVVPADAVTSSGSGLDPDISVEYAMLQSARVARARGITVDDVRTAITDHSTGRVLGLVGEPAVNVVELNLDLDLHSPAGR